MEESEGDGIKYGRNKGVVKEEIDKEEKDIGEVEREKKERIVKKIGNEGGFWRIGWMGRKWEVNEMIGIENGNRGMLENGDKLEKKILGKWGEFMRIVVGEEKNEG